MFSGFRSLLSQPRTTSFDMVVVVVVLTDFGLSWLGKPLWPLPPAPAEPRTGSPESAQPEPENPAMAVDAGASSGSGLNSMSHIHFPPAPCRLSRIR